MKQVKTYTKVTDACPAQWEGELTNGQSFYIRYRFGRLTCNIPYPDSYNQYKEPVAALNIGDPMCGVMSTSDMMIYLADVLDFSKAEWVIDDI